MIKHCLGNSQINSIPAWSQEVFLHNFSLQNTRKSLRISASRYYSFIARNQRNFRPWKLTLSLKVHRRALVPYSLPLLWKICKRIWQFSIFDPATWHFSLSVVLRCYNNFHQHQNATNISVFLSHPREKPRPRHKKPDLCLGFLEHQEIFRKKWDFGGVLDDLEQKLFYILCRFI